MTGESDEAMKSFARLLAEKADDPKRAQYQAFFDAALETLRKGTPGLQDPTRVAIARSIALNCQAAIITPAGRLALTGKPEA